MARRKQGRQTLEMRRELKDDHEPLLTRHRQVHVNDGTFYANIPEEGAKVVGVEASDEIEVEIYETGFFVSVKDSENEPER